MQHGLKACLLLKSHLRKQKQQQKKPPNDLVFHIHVHVLYRLCWFSILYRTPVKGRTQRITFFFGKNTCCGYPLKLPLWGILMSNHNKYFENYKLSQRLVNPYYLSWFRLQLNMWFACVSAYLHVSLEWKILLKAHFLMALPMHWIYVDHNCSKLL